MNEFKIPNYKEQVIPQVENLFKSITLISLLIGSFFVTQIGINLIDIYFLSGHVLSHFILKWVFVISLALLNALLIVGIGMLGHEGAHRVLFNNKFCNDLWGGILAALILIPFHAFREFHLTHHCYTHHPGIDPEEPVNHNRPFFLILAIGGLIGIWLHYKTLVANLLSQPPKRYEGLKDMFFLSVAGALYFGIIPLVGISLWYTFIPTFMFVQLVFSARAISEHHAIPPIFKKNINQNLTFKVDSWIVLTNPLLAWLWSDINYHQVHHRYPYLSHRYLPEIFESTKDKQPYLVVKGYFWALMNLKNRPYYGNYEDLKPFLTTEFVVKS